MPIWLEVNPRSGVPIYLQVIDAVRRALEVGSLKPGDRLPTVREIASEHMIAPNTVQKAFTELQRLGLIESRAGVGTIILPGAGQVVHSQQQQAAIGRLRAAAREAASLGITRTEVESALQEELDKLERSST
ncbi:MAG TPA: GntR family transcriptional regulator [Deinococcales bacterium]|nr:GntR family transcriptional regulator [Deinococcales bacterium]